jgi:hypothetical protein
MQARVRMRTWLYLLAATTACNTLAEETPPRPVPEPRLQELRSCILQRLPRKAIEERQVAGDELVATYLSCQPPGGGRTRHDFRSVMEQMARPNESDLSKVELLPDMGR